jgi:hypothetical protein
MDAVRDGVDAIAGEDYAEEARIVLNRGKDSSAMGEEEDD